MLHFKTTIYNLAKKIIKGTPRYSFFLCPETFLLCVACAEECFRVVSELCVLGNCLREIFMVDLVSFAIVDHLQSD